MEGVIDIQFDLENPNRFKDLLHKISSKAEDILFSILLKLPETLIPGEWMERYINKQISKTNHELIRNRWKQIALNEIIEKSH